MKSSEGGGAFHPLPSPTLGAIWNEQRMVQMRLPEHFLKERKYDSYVRSPTMKHCTYCGCDTLV